MLELEAVRSVESSSTPQPVKKIFIIDAMAMAFRNYHAFGARPLTTSQGLPVSAIYGTAVSLLKIIEEEQPAYLAIATDSREPTFRHKLYAEYKAHRKAMPEDLARQIPHLFDLFKALGIPLIKEPGLEADDLIAAVATQLSSPTTPCYIVSGDKDYLQLICDHIFLYSPQKGGTAKIIDRAGVQERLGCLPEQVIDVLAILGDTSDNVPGVHGIGDKGAADLIRRFGSLEGLYASLESVANLRQRRALEEHRSDAFLSRELVQLKTDIPLHVGLEGMAFDRQRALGRTELRDFFRQMEFRALLAKLPAATDITIEAKSSVPRRRRGEAVYRVVRSAEDLEHCLKSLQHSPTTAVSFVMQKPSADHATTHVRPPPLDAIVLSPAPQHAFVIPWNETDERLATEALRRALAAFLASPDKTKVIHDLKGAYHCAAANDLVLAGPVEDPMLASYLLDSNSRDHDLRTRAGHHLSLDLRSEEESDRSDPSSSIYEGLGLLADATLRLHEAIIPEVKRRGLWSLYQGVEVPLAEVLADMERFGVHVDADVLASISIDFSGRLSRLEEQATALAGESINLQSPRQLQTLLFERLRVHDLLGVKRIKRTQSGFSTDQSVLEQLAEHPLVAIILEHRMLSKLKNTYVDTLPQLIDGRTQRIHTRLHQTGTATGRLSSSEPNLQNIPIRSQEGRTIRRAFTAAASNRVMISADYSQIELRVLAHLCRETAMAAAFRRGADIHRSTAADIFGVSESEVDTTLRSRAKAINFGIIYGMGPTRLAKSTGVSMAEAKEFIEKYFATYPRIREFTQAQVECGKREGRVRTMLGRERGIPEFQSQEPQVLANAANMAMNSPVQGSAADLMKIAMIRVARALKDAGLATRLALQVHDELLLEGPAAEQAKAQSIVRSCMENALPLAVPLAVDVRAGHNWLEAHP